jgi:hypothetical protein
LLSSTDIFSRVSHDELSKLKQLFHCFLARSSNRPGASLFARSHAADKINATVQVFTEPKFYIEMVFVILVLFGAARAKRAARSIPTRVGL